MSTGAAPRRHAEADPWWGEQQPTFVDELEPVAVPTRRRSRRARRTGIGWWLLALLAAPPRALGRLVARSPRLRRLGVRVAVIGLVLAFLGCSVGVILINNVVIGRTAELGELEDRRRELRRDNALLAAEGAKLGQPTVVWRRAERELGMIHPDDLPKFIYLVPGSHPLTPLQRQKVRAARLRAQAQAKARAESQAKQAAQAKQATPAATTTDTTAKQTKEPA